MRTGIKNIGWRIARCAEVACCFRTHLVWLLLLLCGGQTTLSGAEIRLRLAWGGGTPTAWQGRFWLDAGGFSEPRLLGNDPDAARHLRATPSQVLVVASRPLDYQGLDITVNTPLPATLYMELAPRDGLEPPRYIEIPVSDLLSETLVKPLDAAGNRLFVQRVPGDALRVTFAESHLIFDPGQEWTIGIRPHLVHWDDAPRARLQIRMTSSGNDDALWKYDTTLAADEAHEFEAVDPLTLTLPREEGVYELTLRLTPIRPRHLFRVANVSVQRVIQFIVIDPEHTESAQETTPWRESVAFDASQPHWWERLALFPHWKQLSISPVRLRGQGTASSVPLEHGSVSRLEPGGWQSYPLPISQLGAPHVLEIETISTDRQSLAVSVVEPSPEDPQTLVSRDVAMTCAAAVGDHESATREKLRIVFWPHSRMPQVLLTNVDEGRPAFFGSIRLLEGGTLSPASVGMSGHGFRQALADIDRPRFERIFSAQLAVDAESGRSLTDWRTLQEGGRRMIDYLKYAGFSGALVTCYASGSGILPLTDLIANAKFDSGTYFADGRDPVAKDAVELLLRMCDRESLRLMIGLRFDGTHPQLEALLADPAQAEGVSLVDAEGQALSAGGLNASSLESGYNVLDPRVQQVIASAVERVAHRYGRHPSFAGVAIRMGKSTYTQLPSAEWGYDRRTLAAFEQELASHLTLTADGPLTPQALLAEPLRPLWLQWRAGVVSRLYDRISKQLLQVRPDAHLVLSLAETADAEAVQRATRPTLPSPTTMGQAMLEMGIDVVQLSQLPGVVLGKPKRPAPLADILAAGYYEAFSSDQVWTPLLASAPVRATHIYQSPERFVLDDFAPTDLGLDHALMLPLGLESVPTGTSTTRWLSRALLAGDSDWILSGGVEFPLVALDAVRDWLTTFRRLPQGAFLEPPNAASHPVIVRTRVHAGRTYFYAVNNSPWSVRTRVEFQSSADCRFANLSAQRQQDMRWESNGGSSTWLATLKPYELAAGLLTDPEVVLDRVTSELPTDVVPKLQARFSDVASRMATLKNPDPIEGLINAGFDEVAAPDGILGWESVNASSAAIGVDDEAPQAGKRSLRLKSAGEVAWVRSAPIPTPRSGRLAVKAMLRTDPARLPAPLRLGLEGRLHGQPYYRFAQVEWSTPRSNANDAAENGWRPFLLQVNDLPSAGLEELRVRFDLMGAGTVWVDSIQLYDLSFTPDEQLHLSQIIALADFQLRNQQPGDCAHTLEGFWPRFLQQYVPPAPPRMAEAVPPVTIDPPREPSSPSPTSSLFRRVRGLLWR